MYVHYIFKTNNILKVETFHFITKYGNKFILRLEICVSLHFFSIAWIIITRHIDSGCPQRPGCHTDSLCSPLRICSPGSLWMCPRRQLTSCTAPGQAAFQSHNPSRSLYAYGPLKLKKCHQYWILFYNLHLWMRGLVFMFSKDGRGLFFFSFFGSDLAVGIVGSSGEGVVVPEPQGVPWFLRIVQRHW